MPTLLSRSLPHFIWIFFLILMQAPLFSVYAQEPSWVTGQETNTNEGAGFLTPNKVGVGPNGESCCGKDPIGYSNLHDSTGADGVSPESEKSGVQ